MVVKTDIWQWSLLVMANGILMSHGSGMASESSAKLEHEGVIEAPIEEVWNAFTTGEGYTALGVAKADVDLRVGGKIRSHYDPSGVLGDANTIVNTILSFDPLRMISIKVSKPPEGFPYKKAVEHMWTVIHFEPVSAFQTRVRIVGMGFGADEESQKMRAFFEQGNAQTIEMLKKKLGTSGRASDDEALFALGRSLLGDWKFENEQPSGQKFAGRMTVREIMGGAFVVFDTDLSFDGTFRPHGHTIFGKDPVTKAMRAWDFGEQGALSGGRVRLADGNRMLYEWTAQKVGERPQHYFVEEILQDSDSLQFSVFHLKDGDARGEKPQGKPLVSVLWKRVSGKAKVGSMDTIRGVFGDASQNRNMVQGKSITSEITVRAKPKDVWNAWTTVDGVKEFFAPSARIEMRIGGRYEILFRPEATEGLQGSEGCEVLSYIPEEMISFTWNAPPELGTIREQRSFVVVRFEDGGVDQTRVTLEHLGFGEGDDWEKVAKYFEKAWPVVLGRLKESFEANKAARQ